MATGHLFTYKQYRCKRFNIRELQGYKEHGLEATLLCQSSYLDVDERMCTSPPNVCVCVVGVVSLLGSSAGELQRYY